MGVLLWIAVQMICLSSILVLWDLCVDRDLRHPVSLACTSFIVVHLLLIFPFLQANTTEELPERLIGAVRVSHIELSSAIVPKLDPDLSWLTETIILPTDFTQSFCLDICLHPISNFIFSCIIYWNGHWCFQMEFCMEKIVEGNLFS